MQEKHIKKELASVQAQIKALESKASDLRRDLTKTSIDYKEIDEWVKTALEFEKLKGQTILWKGEKFGVIEEAQYNCFVVKITHPLIKVISNFTESGDKIFIEDNDNELRAFGKKFKFKTALFNKVSQMLLELSYANWSVQEEFYIQLRKARKPTH